MDKLTRDKHSSLLRTFVKYRRKKFYNIWPKVTLQADPPKITIVNKECISGYDFGLTDAKEEEPVKLENDNYHFKLTYAKEDEEQQPLKFEYKDEKGPMI